MLRWRFEETSFLCFSVRALAFDFPSCNENVGLESVEKVPAQKVPELSAFLKEKRPSISLHLSFLQYMKDMLVHPDDFCCRTALRLGSPALVRLVASLFGLVAE